MSYCGPFLVSFSKAFTPHYVSGFKYAFKFIPYKKSIYILKITYVFPWIFFILICAGLSKSGHNQMVLFLLRKP